MADRVYLDTCALNRPTDDLSQRRIREEAAAVSQILTLASADQLLWIASTVVSAELLRNADVGKREDALLLLGFAAQLVQASAEAYGKSLSLQAQGFGAADALHLTVAEENQVEWLITVDDRLIGRAARLRPGKAPMVVNPIDWLRRRSLWLLKR